MHTFIWWALHKLNFQIYEFYIYEIEIIKWLDRKIRTIDLDKKLWLGKESWKIQEEKDAIAGIVIIIVTATTSILSPLQHC